MLVLRIRNNQQQPALVTLPDSNSPDSDMEESLT